MSFEADIDRARRLIPLVEEGFAPGLRKPLAVCTVSPGDRHYPGRLATPHDSTTRSPPPKRPAAASCAGPAVSVEAGILRRATMIAKVADKK